MTINNFPLRCEDQPQLHGYWGGGIHTISNQACQLGIPAIQL
jgi:hypothetical protein